MSEPTAIDASAALPARFGLWLSERFPPVTYTLLVSVYGMAGLSVGWATGGERSGWLVLPVVWLFFLHLRVLDEHKDHERDQHTHPERALSRGVVTLGLLAVVGWGALAAQSVLVSGLGLPAGLAWLGSVLFSGLMYVEFGVGRWLERRIVLYALTHNPVMLGLAWMVVLATGAQPHWAHVAFAALSSLAMLGFEFARKTYLPDEEHAEVPSYTSELGQSAARGMLALTYVAATAALVATLWLLGVAPLLTAAAAAMTLLPGLITSAPGRPAKQVELGGSVVLLVSLMSIILLCWTV